MGVWPTALAAVLVFSSIENIFVQLPCPQFATNFTHTGMPTSNF